MMRGSKGSTVTSAPLTIDAIIESARGLFSGGQDAPEERQRKRVKFDVQLPLILITRDGQRWGPMLVRGWDLSACGMSVVTRQMIHEGLRGVVQLRRSNGQMAMIGVEVMHCRYIGAMQHLTGLRFTREAPDQLSPEAFIGRDGSMMRLDENLRGNAGEKPAAH